MAGDAGRVGDGLAFDRALAVALRIPDDFQRGDVQLVLVEGSPCMAVYCIGGGRADCRNAYCRALDRVDHCQCDLCGTYSVEHAELCQGEADKTGVITSRLTLLAGRLCSIFVLN